MVRWLILQGRARGDPDVEGTWTWAILGSIPATGKEDCADRCSQEASRNNLSNKRSIMRSF